MAQKHPTDPKPIQLASYRKDKSISEEFKESAERFEQKIDELERAKYQADSMRATLLINFGPDGILGSKLGISIADYLHYSTHQLMVCVLSELARKADSTINLPDIPPDHRGPKTSVSH